jgi:ribonuclease HI
MVNLRPASKKVLILTYFKSAIKLIKKINYEAADSDLKSIKDSLLSLKYVDTSVCFHHIPSHKGLTHNMTANRLANEGTNACAPPDSKLGNLQDFIKHWGK